MKVIEVKTLKIPEIKVITYARFSDQRGYFTETYRKSDFLNLPEMECFKGIEFVQCNESFSKKGTIRGMHFQWNPYMGKLVRTIYGRMVDLVLDIRKESPSFGKMIAYEMPTTSETVYSEWIWVPPGFAHGNFFSENSIIEYFCTGEYNPECEAGISPLAKDIDWTSCDAEIKSEFDAIASTTSLITDKDKNGLTLEEWNISPNSNNFFYNKLGE